MTTSCSAESISRALFRIYPLPERTHGHYGSVSDSTNLSHSDRQFFQDTKGACRPGCQRHSSDSACSAALTVEAVPGFVGTSLGSFRVGGGLVLLLMSLAMLRAESDSLAPSPMNPCLMRHVPGLAWYLWPSPCSSVPERSAWLSYRWIAQTLLITGSL